MVKAMNKKAQKQIKGILFDLNGTLTKPGAVDINALKQEINCPKGKSVMEYMETLPTSQQKRFSKILELKEDRFAEQSFANNGAEKCLSLLNQKGILFGIFTRNNRKAVLHVLKKFKGVRIEDFAVIVARGDARSKPSPDGVCIAANKMGIPISELMVVGDSRLDILAGKAAGALTALLANEGRTDLLTRDPEPDFTIHTLHEILDII